MTRAAAAVTCGAAIDVPLQYAINPPLAHTDPVGRAVERISTPGAAMSISGPMAAKLALVANCYFMILTLSTTSAW